MLNKLAKLLLVLTAFAPVLITYGFVEFTSNGLSSNFFVISGIAIGLIFLCLLIIKAAKKQLGVINFNVTQVKSADSETVGFILIYLLPLINMTDISVNLPVLLFIFFLFFLIVWSTNAYHFNPLMGLFGYHFYEVTSNGNIVFLLITKSDIRSTAQINRVVQLTEYIVLDKEGD